MEKQWTLEEKEAYIENVKRWKSELIKCGKKNIFAHPDAAWKPYYVVKEGKFFKYKPYKIMNGQIRYVKNGEIEYIPVSKISDAINKLFSPEVGMSRQDCKTFTIDLMVEEYGESPFYD